MVKDRKGVEIEKGAISGLKCKAGVCFNPDTNKLEIQLDRDSCPPDVIKGVVENIVKGVEVQVVVPPVKKEGEK